MLPLRLVTKEYDKNRHMFKAILPSDEIVYFDPFIGGAIELSDEDYVNDRGFEYVNKVFLLTDFSVGRWNVNSYMIVPNEYGIVYITPETRLK